MMSSEALGLQIPKFINLEKFTQRANTEAADQAKDVKRIIFNVALGATKVARLNEDSPLSETEIESLKANYNPNCDISSEDMRWLIRHFLM